MAGNDLKVQKFLKQLVFLHDSACASFRVMVGGVHVSIPPPERPQFRSAARPSGRIPV
jgi:hypothetical protein